MGELRGVGAAAGAHRGPAHQVPQAVLARLETLQEQVTQAGRFAEELAGVAAQRRRPQS